MDTALLCCTACADMSDIRTTARKIVAWNPPGPKRLVVVTQELTLDKGRTVTTCMEMDRPTSALAQFLDREILTPLGVARADAYVTELVRCWFIAAPSQLARERAVAATEILRPPARRCLTHLDDDIERLQVETVIALGDDVYSLLREEWNVAAGPIASVFGTRVRFERRGRTVALIPCVYIPGLAGDAAAPFEAQATRLARLRVQTGATPPPAH